MPTDATHSSPEDPQGCGTSTSAPADPLADPAATITTLQQIRRQQDPPLGPKALCPNRCPHRTRRKIFRRSQIGVLLTGLAAIWASELVPAAPVLVLEYIFAATIGLVALSGILPRAFHGLFWWLGLDRAHTPLLDEREQYIAMVAAVRTLQTLFGLLMAAITVLVLLGHGHSPVIYALFGAALVISGGPLVWRFFLSRRM